jgi:transmembrane sensor
MNEEHFSGKEEATEQAYRTAYLIAGYIQSTLTEEEHDELDKWVAAKKENLLLFEELTDDKNIASTIEWYKNLDAEKALGKVKERIVFSKQRPLKTSKIWIYSVAASIILLIGGYFAFFNKPTHRGTVANSNALNDVLPGSDKAILSIAGSKPIVLDTIREAYLKELGITRKEGKLIYQDPNTNAELHSLIIPRKGKYQLQLNDGTKVWLNSESSINFPTVFKGNERRVKVTGEVYIEVAKDTRPFIANVNGIEIKALGTEFSINAYTNEPGLSTTLIEGSVRISAPDNEVILKPNQRADLDNKGEFKVSDVDVSSIIAWKNNQFKFEGQLIQPIMRQVERWYDVEVVYKDEVPTHHFHFTIPRDEPLSGLLKILEGTGRVHFKIEGNKVIVSK